MSSEFAIVGDAIDAEDCEKIDELIGSGIDPNTTQEGDQWNFLHYALVSVAIPPDPNVVRRLISYGVDVNARDHLGWTPLLFAVRTKNVAVIKMLLDAGADVNAVNDKGISPLHQSLLRRPRDLEVVQTLLDGGADPDNDQGGGTARRYVNAISADDADTIRQMFDQRTK